MKALIVIDAQNDFIIGPLGTSEAIIAKDNIANWLNNHNYDVVYFTKDTHKENTYLNTQEGKKLPVKHCLIGTKGRDIADVIIEATTNHFVEIINKDTFGYINWAFHFPKPEKIESIDIMGFCTDICVISNALILKALYPEVEINVITDCCAGTTPEQHQTALNVMRACQINIMEDSTNDES